jgi:hypothetical protein
MKSPPDWDKAEKYGRANMCVDSARQVLDLEQPDTYCPFSQLPYPTADQFFGLWEPCDNLAELG